MSKDLATWQNRKKLIWWVSHKPLLFESVVGRKIMKLLLNVKLLGEFSVITVLAFYRPCRNKYLLYLLPTIW